MIRLADQVLDDNRPANAETAPDTSLSSRFMESEIL